MDFIDQLRAIGERAAKQRDHLQTEEATKTALIMPFINALGYNLFDPTEVVPEFTADVGIKKGEKVDYAIKLNGRVIIIFECKSIGTELDKEHASQLHRYFAVVDARIAVLTNGVVYRFFTDLDEPNKMDQKPFLELNLQDLKEPLVDEVKKLHKASFDLEKLLSAASDLKYLTELKRIIADEIANPSDDLVKLLAKQVYPGLLTQAVRDQFRDIIRRGFQQVISDRLTSRLKSALDQEVRISDEAVKVDVEVVAPPPGVVDVDEDRGIITTEEEMEGFRIVRAILREVVDVKRVQHRDTKSYFGVLLDDNNRKPLVRLRFTPKTRYLGLIDAEKNEEKVPLDSLDDIYKHADRIKATVRFYDETPS